MEFKYAYDYQRQSRAALGRLKSKLEGLVKSASEMGQPKEADSLQKHVDNLTGWCDAVQVKEIPEPAEATPQLRDYLRRGLAMLAHNFNAAAGTVTALGRRDIAEEFKAEANAIEGMLLPVLDEQIGLKLEGAKPKSGSK